MARLIQEDTALLSRRHIDKLPQADYLVQLQMTLDEVRRYSSQTGLRSGEKIMEMLIQYSDNLTIHLGRLKALQDASCIGASHTNSTGGKSVRHI